MMKSSYEIYPKNLVAQNMIFQNMSNHYRKLYNAKSRVDSRPPLPCKTSKVSSFIEPKRTKSGLWVNNRTPSNFDEVDKKRTTYRQCCSDKNVNYMCDDLPNYQPRILKTTVESKIRNLKVYHPPRRRPPIPSMKQQIKLHPTLDLENEEVENEHWIQTVEPLQAKNPHSSKLYGSDSAYTEEGEVGWSGGESRGETPIEANTLPSTPVLEWTSRQRSYRSDDLLYVKFLREITEEVLRKGVFTNRALKQIFQDHIKANKHNLDMIRMQEEIDKLREELAIPKEDYLNDMDFGLGSDRSIDVKTTSSETIHFPDKELLDALNQLDISEELKADVANSLGLRSNSKSFNSRQSSLTSVEEHNVDKPVDNHVHISRKDLHIHLPSSDEDSSNTYEVSSECSESSRNTSSDGI